MGIGQAGMVSYRFDLVEYLHWMYVHEFLLSTIKPKDVASLGTLVYPFDGYVWAFTIASVISVLICLMVARKLWLNLSRSAADKNYIFHGNSV